MFGRHPLPLPCFRENADNGHRSCRAASRTIWPLIVPGFHVWVNQEAVADSNLRRREPDPLRERRNVDAPALDEPRSFPRITFLPTDTRRSPFLGFKARTEGADVPLPLTHPRLPAFSGTEAKPG